MKRISYVLVAALFGLASGLGFAADTKSDEKVIGTDKKTGGEARGDREKVQEIKDGAARLKEQSAKETRQRKEAAEPAAKEKKDKN